MASNELHATDYKFRIKAHNEKRGPKQELAVHQATLPALNVLIELIKNALGQSPQFTATNSRAQTLKLPEDFRLMVETKSSVTYDNRYLLAIFIH